MEREIPSAADTERCLLDCGFPGESRRQYLHCATDRLPLLYRQRKALMDDLHAVQRKVDAVDYLIRAVERASGQR